MPLLSRETQLLLALAVCAASWGLRGRFPVGVGLGWSLISGASAALLLTTHAVDDAASRSRLVFTLGALGVFCFLAAQYVSVRATGALAATAIGADAPARPREVARREAEVLLIGGLFAALSCVAIGLYETAGERPGEPLFERFLATILVVALAAAVMPAWSGFTPRAYCVAGGLLAAAIAALQRAPVTGVADQWPWLMLIASAAGLLACCADVLRCWWQRRTAWMQSPTATAPSPEPAPGLAPAQIVIGVLLLASVLVCPDARVQPFALLFGALGALVCGHHLRSVGMGEFGLALLAAAMIAAGRAWIANGTRGWLFGTVVAAVYMLWLSRFWQQQLHAGRAWTSTGRLIAPARRICHALVALAAGASTYQIWHHAASAGSAPRGALDVLTTLALFVLGSLLVRDASSWGRSSSAGFACLAVLSLASRLTELPGVAIEQPSGLVLVAMAVSLLALRVALARESGPDHAVYNALVGGVLPALLAAAALYRGIDSVWLGAAILAGGAWMLGTLRGRRDEPRDDHAVSPGGA